MDRSEKVHSHLCLEHLAIQIRAQLADPRTASHAFDLGERVYSLSCVHFPVTRGIVLQLQGVRKTKREQHPLLRECLQSVPQPIETFQEA